jgi:IS5 family transposase
MIEMRRAQRSFGDGLIAEEVSDLREDWMKHADAVLADDEIARRVRGISETASKSRCRGRRGAGRRGAAAAGSQHIRNWSYGCWSVRSANLVYRDFTMWAAPRPRMPRHGPLGRRARARVLKQVHEGVVRIARRG